MARRMTEETKRQNSGFEHSKSHERLTSFNHVTVIKTTNLEKQLGGTFSLQYNHDATELAAGFGGGGIKLYKPTTGEFVRELKPNRHGGLAVMCLRYHPKIVEPSLLYAGTAEGSLYIMDTRAQLPEPKPAIVEDKNQINVLDFNSDGFIFATCGKDLCLRIYDTNRNTLVKDYKGISAERALSSEMEAGNTKRVFALKFTANENILITAGWDNHIKIWDIRTNDGLRRQFSGPHVCGDALDINDNGHILTGSWVAKDALQVWDYGEGKLIRTIPFPHQAGAFLYCAEYGDLGVALAGGSGTNSLEIMEIATDRHVGGVQMGKAVQCMDSVLGGRYFCVGGQDPVLKFCKLH